MPTYVYGVILSEEDDEAIGDVFEVEQGIRDQPLTQHPETGQPVRRLLCAPYIAGIWSPMKMKKSMADNTLAKRGFTKYVKNPQARSGKLWTTVSRLRRAASGADLTINRVGFACAVDVPAWSIRIRRQDPGRHGSLAGCSTVTYPGGSLNEQLSFLKSI